MTMKAPDLNEKIADELRKMLEHVAGELHQRVADLEAKAERPWGGALSGRGPASHYAAQVMLEAVAPIEAALAGLPQPTVRPGARPAVVAEPPLHPRHPDKASGKPPVRG